MTSNEFEPNASLPMSASPPLFVKITIARLGLFERALVDTGATMTLIRENLARPLLNYLEVNTKATFITADGRRADCLGTLTLSIRHGIFFKLSRRCLTILFSDGTGWLEAVPQLIFLWEWGS